MQLSFPVIAGLVIGALVIIWCIRPRRSKSYTPLPRRSGCSSGTLALILLTLIAALTLAHLNGFSPSWSSISNALASSQHALTKVQASISQSDTASVYQSLPLPQTTHQNYVDLARKDATAVGFVPAVFIRQINQESGFDPNASGAAGEIGIAQFMPDTARSLGIDAHDPVAALSGAAHLMASYLQTFNGDYEKALAAYNAGAGTVEQAVAKDGANWKQAIPASTRQYIATILNEGV